MKRTSRARFRWNIWYRASRLTVSFSFTLPMISFNIIPFNFLWIIRKYFRVRCFSVSEVVNMVKNVVYFVAKKLPFAPKRYLLCTFFTSYRVYVKTRLILGEITLLPKKFAWTYSRPKWCGISNRLWSHKIAIFTLHFLDIQPTEFKLNVNLKESLFKSVQRKYVGVDHFVCITSNLLIVCGMKR